MEQQNIIEINESEQEFTLNAVQETIIANKWEKVRISSIKEVEITNKQYYEESKEVAKPSLFNYFTKTENQQKVDQKGLLQSASLKISFTISKSTSILSPSLLSYRKSDNVLPTNHRSKIEIIYNNVNEINQSTTTDGQHEEEIYTIEFPFYSGLENLKTPLLDDFHSKGDNLIHHTIVIDAYDEHLSSSNSLRSLPEISYFIRLVIKDYKEVQITSISTSNIDNDRVAKIFENSKEISISTALALKNTIFDLFGKCKSSKKNNKNDNNVEHPQVQYCLLTNSQNVNNDVEAANSKEEMRISEVNSQFQKFDLQGYATPLPFPVQLPPNCQIVYCINPNVTQN